MQLSISSTICGLNPLRHLNSSVIACVFDKGKGAETAWELNNADLQNYPLKGVNFIYLNGLDAQLSFSFQFRVLKWMTRVKSLDFQIFVNFIR